MPFAVGAHHSFDFQSLFHGNIFIYRDFFSFTGTRNTSGSRAGRGTRSSCGIDLHKIEPQGVRYHAETRKAHRRGAEHRVQAPTEQRFEQARGKRYAADIIEECPEEVLPDVPQHLAAETYRCRHIRQAALHQHHIGGIDCGIQPGSHGNPDIGGSQGGGIVDTVTDHSHLAAVHEGAHASLLVARQQSGPHLVHTGLTAYSTGSASVVSGQHDHAYSHVPEFGHRADAVFTEHIGDGDDSLEHPSAAEKERDLPRVGKFLRHTAHSVGHGAIPFYETYIPSINRLSVYPACHSPARKGLEPVRRGAGDSLGNGLPPDGLGERMSALHLQRIRRPEQGTGVLAAGRQYIRDFGSSPGQRPRLVEHDCLHPSRLFQRGRVLEQYAVTCTRTAAGDYRHRGCKPESAGAAHHEDRHRMRKRRPDACTGYHPAGKGQDGNRYHCRNEYRGDLVRKACYRGLCRRSVFHKLHNPGECRVLPYAQSPAAQEAGHIDRSGRYSRSRRLVDGNALAGKRRLVDRTASVKHQAVRRDALSRTHNEDISGPYLSDGNLLLPAVPLDHGESRRKSRESPERIGSPAHGTGLQHLAYGNQHQNHGRSVEIQMRNRASLDGEHHETIQESCPRAERHQSIHVGRSGKQGLRSAPEKFRIDSEHSRRKKQLEHAGSSAVPVEEGRKRPVPHRGSHGDIHQG